MTNNALDVRADSELYTFDIATGLQRRGHRVIVYSSLLGKTATDLRLRGVPTIDDLSALTETPDVIHGQHHLDAAAACLRFPETPAVYVCHGWLPWQETPVTLASVRRFVAVSTLTRDYLITTGADPTLVSIIPNFVDVERFKNTRPRGAPFRRALAYGNAWRPGSIALKVLRQACNDMGLEFETVGAANGNSADRPETLLPTFDIVFAAGRSALEAMACGCAVIVADAAGIHDLVTTGSFEHQKNFNFGLGLFAGRDVTPERVDAALRKINADDVARTTELVREQMNLDRAIAQWERVYAHAVAAGPVSAPEMITSASRFVVKHKKAVIHFEDEVRSAKDRLAELATEKLYAEREAARLKTLCDTLQEEKTSLQEDKTSLETMLGQCRSELAAVESQINLITTSRSWRLTHGLRRINRFLDQRPKF